MSDLSQLRETILQETQEKGLALFNSQKNKLEAEYEEKRSRMVLEKETERSRKVQALEEKQNRFETQLVNREKLAVLSEKQDVLNKLFEEASSKLNQLSSSDLMSFLGKILNRYTTQKAKVTFGENSKQVLSNAEFNELVEKYTNLEFSNDTIPGEGGVVVSVDKVDYNYLFSKMMTSIKTEMSTEILDQLFK